MQIKIYLYSSFWILIHVKKKIGCIKEAKSTGLHFTKKQKQNKLKNILKRATYYIISNHSLVAIFKTLGSALLTILIKQMSVKNNMLLIDFTYHSFSSFKGGYNFLHSQWTRLNLLSYIIMHIYSSCFMVCDFI